MKIRLSDYFDTDTPVGAVGWGILAVAAISVVLFGLICCIGGPR